MAVTLLTLPHDELCLLFDKMLEHDNDPHESFLRLLVTTKNLCRKGMDLYEMCVKPFTVKYMCKLIDRKFVGSGMKEYRQMKTDLKRHAEDERAVAQAAQLGFYFGVAVPERTPLDMDIVKYRYLEYVAKIMRGKRSQLLAYQFLVVAAIPLAGDVFPNFIIK